jgi:alkyl hydroperoxide reductase subunit AhpF
MPLLNDQIRKDVQAMLADLPNSVTMKVFTQQFECQYCRETRELVEEVAAVSDQISVEVWHSSVTGGRLPDRQDPGRHRRGQGLRGALYIPSGYEFGALTMISSWCRRMIRLAAARRSPAGPADPHPGPHNFT